MVDGDGAGRSPSATRGGDDRFYDIDFRAMQRDPVGEVRGLYDWLGEPVTDGVRDGHGRWWQDNADDREPNVHPDPADFGLDLDEVRSAFSAYNARRAQWTAHQEHRK